MGIFFNKLKHNRLYRKYTTLLLLSNVTNIEYSSDSSVGEYFTHIEFINANKPIDINHIGKIRTNTPILPPRVHCL